MTTLQTSIDTLTQQITDLRTLVEQQNAPTDDHRSENGAEDTAD